MFDDVLAKYSTLEPEGMDRWNPLVLDLQIWHRTRLFVCLAQALRQIPVPIAEMKILDVGCGVGRSTRALLELGAKPGNLLGIDLRPSALDYARSVNPAIPVKLVTTFTDWPPAGSFDLCMQCTAFSSIKGMERRRALAEQMEQMVPPGRYVFWWDLLIANDFAGGDRLEPSELFERCELIMERQVPLQPMLEEAARRRLVPVARLFQRLLGRRPLSRAALLRRTK